ncbi:MAG: putative transposase [Flavobacteriales bacterium]
MSNDWNFLTTVIDLVDRKVFGWSLSKDMTTENKVKEAWLNARNNRNIRSGFIFHSDRGVQYAANKMTRMFTFNRKSTQSMSRKGNCWEDVTTSKVAESFFNSIKQMAIQV